MKLPLLSEVYRNAGLVDSGRYPNTVSEFADQLPALRPEVLREAADAVIAATPAGVTKVVVEEGKGVPLGTAVALAAGLPLAIARIYSHDFPGRKVTYDGEDEDAALYLNGVVAGDQVLVVEDTTSSGGVLVALIRTIREQGAEVAGVVAVVDKVLEGGVERVRRETGVAIQTLLPITIEDGRVKVLN
jgi:adenine phosphoribosyltransferase